MKRPSRTDGSAGLRSNPEIRSLLLCLPALSVSIGVAAVPVCFAVMQVASHATLKSYMLSFLTDPVRRGILIRSILLPCGVTGIGLVLALLTAMAFLPVGRQRYLVATGLLIPLVVHPMVLVFGFMVVLRQGPVANMLNQAFRFLGPHGGSWGSVTITMVFLLYPLAAWFAIRAVSRIPLAERLAALNAGSTRLEVMIHLILPRSRDAFVGGGLLVFVQAMGFFVVPVLVGDGWVNTIPVYVTDRIDSGMVPAACAMALLLMPPIAAAVVLGLRPMLSAWLGEST